MAKLMDTRTKLVKAAIDLFYEHGVHWVSFQQIGTRVGVTQAALYKHFADKDDLLKACALASAESGREIIDSGVERTGSSAEKIRAYIRGNFEWQARHPKEAVVILSLYYFGFNSRPLHELLQSINEASVARLAERIKEGQRDGQFAPSRVEKKARVLHSLMLGELIKAVHDPKAMTPDERTRLVWAGFEKNLV